jgi:hypothetical protein
MIKFELTISPDENAAFRERLLNFVSRYAPGGWGIGVEFEEVHSRMHEVSMVPHCRYMHTVLEDIVRAAAPVGKIAKYLSSVNSTATCVEGLKSDVPAPAKMLSMP